MRISIITVTHNRGRTLRDTFESVLSQTFSDYEHIIVDGASADDTRSVVREYEPRYKGRLRFVSEPDKGLYEAMNKGLAMASGEIVGFLNSDDFFTSDSILGKVAAAMDDPSVDAVYGDVHYVSSGDLSKCVRYYHSGKFRLRQMKWGYIPAQPSFYCRRSVYLRYGAFADAYRQAADFELLLRFLLIHKIRARYLPADFVTMRAGGISNAGVLCYWRSIRERLKACRDNGVRTNVFLLLGGNVWKLAGVILFRVRTCLKNAAGKGRGAAL